MEENQENNTEVTQGNDLKQETFKTFNEAKEQMKNINFKQEAEVGKGLLKKLWKNPLETIKEIAADEENKTLKTSILLVAVWAVIILIYQIIYYATNKYIKFNFLSTVKVTVAPILRVIAMTFALYLVNKNTKKSVSRVLTSVGIAYIPSIISSLLEYLIFISSNVFYVLNPIQSLLYILSVVLMYQTIKATLQEEEEATTLKQFVKVEAIFYVLAFAFSFLGIHL